jgi:hypothetical protein
MDKLQDAGQNQNMTIAKQIVKNVSQLKCLGMAVADQNLIREAIKRETELW